MPPTTRYSNYLGDLEPVATMRRNADRIRALAGSWTPEQFERTYAPGKWTARQILTHLAHTEMALGTRARMALSTPNYTAQPFDQDRWVARENRVERTRSRRRLCRVWPDSTPRCSRGSPPPTARPECPIPSTESSPSTWIIHLLPGHQLHHLAQLEQIGARQGSAAS